MLEVAEKLDASPGRSVQSRFERVIHGRGTDGTLYSLFNNDLRSSGHSRPPNDTSRASFNRAEYSYYVWHVSTYAVGKDLVDADSSLAAIHLSFSVLREWMSEEAVLESVWPDSLEDGLTIPEGRSFERLVDGATIVLHDNFKVSGTRYKSSIEYDPFFEIVDPASRLDEIVSDWVLPLQRLVMFLSSQAAHATKIRICRLGSETFTELHLPTTQAPATDQTTAFFFFFLHRRRLEEMGVPLGSIIENWFQLEAESPYLAEAIEVVTTARYPRDGIALFWLFRTVELFHADYIGGRAVPQDQHRARVKRIISQLSDEEDQTWVEGVLNDKNRKGLKRVLEDVLEHCGETGKSLLQQHPTFVRAAIKSRNQLVHNQEQGGQSSEDADNIYRGLLWIIRRLVTEQVLGSSELADTYMTAGGRPEHYLPRA